MQSKPSRGSRPIVLVVEDDDWLRAIVATLLDDEGYDVVQAGTGAQGARLAKERSPDAILLDLGLPSGSGLDVLRDVRADERTGETPVLLMTGSPELAEQALGDGTPVRIPKPLDFGDLLARLEQCRAERARAA